jgi:leucyl/phenylalanyl-tRNA--protein transferase
MLNAYVNLHNSGYAHSVEAWQGDKLVGGLYGVSIGKCFFGESMFAEVSNASKAAFITLVNHLKENGFWLIDCQVHTDHLESLGAKLFPRKSFLDILEQNKTEKSWIGKWALY